MSDDKCSMFNAQWFCGNLNFKDHVSVFVEYYTQVERLSGALTTRLVLKILRFNLLHKRAGKVRIKPHDRLVLVS